MCVGLCVGVCVGVVWVGVVCRGGEGVVGVGVVCKSCVYGLCRSCV